MITNNLANVRQYIAERIHIAANTPIDCGEALRRSHVDVYRAFNQAADTLVVMLDAYVYGMPKERIDVDERWPTDWWQAFRERWFPAWWLRRWPVRYNTVSVHKQLFGRVCPHIHEPEQKKHLQWMSQGDGDEVPSEE